MKLDILFDVPVSYNLKEKENITCSYPQSIILANGDIACAYRKGLKKHSYDGILVFRTSSDDGKTWSEEKIIFDGRESNPLQSVVSGGMCQKKDGTLLASFCLVEPSRTDVYLFSEEGEKFKQKICIQESKDLGETWKEPVVLDIYPYKTGGITTKPFVLNDDLFVPVEVKTDLGSLATCGTYFTNPESSKKIFTCVSDQQGKLNFCDAHFTVLENGHILMLLWTFIQKNEETINIHKSISKDNGRTWSYPSQTSLKGQVTSPLAVSKDIVIAASNYRHPSEGIRLYYSKDGGNEFEKNKYFQMWDLTQEKMLGCLINAENNKHKNDKVWDALEKFSFGTPDLVKIDERKILLTYYATLEGIIHVRACLFCLA